MFSGARAQYHATILGNGDIQVVDLRGGSPDGTDTTHDIESFVFADGTFSAADLLNTPPVIISDGGGDNAAVSVPENGTAVTTVAATEANGDPITYAIVGGADAAMFQIDATSGALSFVAAPDFESPADQDHDNSYVVQVRAFDGGFIDDQVITVNVADVAPSIIGDGGNNSLVGTAENDTIQGLGGDDTAVFSQNLDKYKRVADFGNMIVVVGPDGTDTLTSIEHLQFADGTIM